MASSLTLQYMDDKLDLVLSHPKAWGGLEALEPLVLMLLMCRQYVESGVEDERTLLRSYRKHLAESLGPSSAGLKDRLSSEDDLSKAVEILRNFVMSCRTTEARG